MELDLRGQIMKNSVIYPLSGTDAKEPGREIQFPLDEVYMHTDLPSDCLGLVPFRSQLYKAFNTTFKLMVFLLEKKK